MCWKANIHFVRAAEARVNKKYAFEKLSSCIAEELIQFN